MRLQIPYAWGFAIYKKSPFPIQRIFDLALKPIPRSLMLGSGFHEKLRLLRESEKWGQKRLIEFQERALTNLIKHAYKNVPYYHKIFKEKGLSPSDIKKTHDLSKLPILTKDEIRNHFSEITAVNYRQFKPGTVYTSGSTGKPLEFYLDQQNREWEYASQWRQVFWGGIKDVNVRIATFRGDFVFEYGKTNRVTKWHGLHKELVFNTYLLDPENIKKMIEALNKFRPELIKGFPHAIYAVAKTVLTEGLSLNFKPKVIQTSSEFIPTHMRDTIEEAFDSKIFDWYSQSEYVVSIGQCECEVYHQTMETGIAMTVEDEWGFERLVGTGLWNYSMPFINYEIGDILQLNGGSYECECGRELLIVNSIEGRVNDIIITPSQKAISGGAFDHYWKHRIMYQLKTIPEYVHFVQEKLDKVVMEVYSTHPLLKDDVDTIVKELKLLFGDEMEIEIKYLPKIPSIKKWRFIESRVVNKI